jgi:enoyl-CoA hydratase/carnithine racemase
LPAAQRAAHSIANGPTLAHAMTKKMLFQEWAMPLDAAIDAEADAQAQLMLTADFKRAYDAFVSGATPHFEGD